MCASRVCICRSAPDADTTRKTRFQKKKFTKKKKKFFFPALLACALGVTCLPVRCHNKHTFNKSQCAVGLAQQPIKGTTPSSVPLHTGLQAIVLFHKLSRTCTLQLPQSVAVFKFSMYV